MGDLVTSRGNLYTLEFPSFCDLVIENSSVVEDKLQWMHEVMNEKYFYKLSSVNIES